MPSILSHLIRALIKFNKPKGKTLSKSVARLRIEFEKDMSRYKLPKKVKVEAISIENINGEWIVPPNSDSSRTLFYIHGGGFYAGSLETHRAAVARFSEALGIRALHINYRLAPKYPFPSATEDCLSVYKWLILNGVPAKSIIIGGDSAGGTLTLNTLISCRNQGIQLPAGAFCLSPLTDFSFKSDSMVHQSQNELFYNLDELEWVRQIYAGDYDHTDPNLSPIYANFTGLPPLLIHTTDKEMLCDDAIRLANKAKNDGVEVELKNWNGLFHAFQLIPFLTESKIALKEITSFSKKIFSSLK